MSALDPTGLVVEEAQVVVHKADQPDLLLDLADADALAGEDVAEAGKNCSRWAVIRMSQWRVPGRGTKPRDSCLPLALILRVREKRCAKSPPNRSEDQPFSSLLSLGDRSQKVHH